MKKLNIILCLSVILYSTNLFAETIYTRTTHIAMVGDCFVFQTTFWGNNNTPETSADDRFLGVDYLMDCPDNRSVVLVPDFTDPYFHPKTAEELKKFDNQQEGKLQIPVGIKYIPYDEYLIKAQKLDEEMGNLKTIPQEKAPIKTIKLSGIKNE